MSYPSFEVVAEAIPHIVWMADVSGSTDYFNERGTEYTGLAQQANYGWDRVQLVHPHDAERARLGWEHAGWSGRSASFAGCSGWSRRRPASASAMSAPGVSLGVSTR